MNVPPFSVLPPKVLKPISKKFIVFAKKLEPTFPFLKLHLEQAQAKISSREYLSMSFASTLILFVVISIIAGFISISLEKSFLIGPLIALIISIFVFIEQLAYPRLLSNKRVRNLERNLLAALQDLLIQLNSGVPLFNILLNISEGNYGEVSTQFKKAVKQINAGVPQIDALEKISKETPSLFFRRTIWQIVNGMKAGSDLKSVIKEVTENLSEEQLLQIQKYGSTLNPLAMFYMLIAVILPALGITLVIILLSFISLSDIATKMVLWGIYGFVLFFQIIFLGIIKSRRPNLLD